MQRLSPSERSRRRAQVSWEQAQDDLQQARERIKKAPDASCLLSMQGAINALSSLPESQGIFQLPSYSVVEMLDVCVPMAADLEAIRNRCYVLDGLLERDVMGNAQQKNIRFTSAYARTIHEAAQAVVQAVQEALNRDSETFFKP
ncbi:MAG: hypothetical protein ACO4AU_04180 [bacterium]|jgi:hypothetical protein